MMNDPERPRQQWIEKLRDGRTVLIRPIRKEDATHERNFIAGLSLQSRYFRFGHGGEVSQEAIDKLTDIDHEREAAFIALVATETGAKQIGASRYCLCSDNASAECVVAVSDEYHHQGLGTLLMRHLIEYARAHGVQQLFSVDAANNRSTRGFAAHLGFHRETDPGDTTVMIHKLEVHPSRAHV